MWGGLSLELCYICECNMLFGSEVVTLNNKLTNSILEACRPCSPEYVPLKYTFYNSSTIDTLITKTLYTFPYEQVWIVL